MKPPHTFGKPDFMQPFDVNPETLTRAEFDALLVQLQREGWFSSAPARRDRAVQSCLLPIQAAIHRGETEEAIYRINKLAAYAALRTPHILSQLPPQTGEEISPVLQRALERHMRASLVPLARAEIVGAWINPLKKIAHLFVRPGHTLHILERNERLRDDLELSLSCHAGCALVMQLHSTE